MCISMCVVCIHIHIYVAQKIFFSQFNGLSFFILLKVFFAEQKFKIFIWYNLPIVFLYG